MPGIELMREDPVALRALANQCRRLACGASTAEAAETLRSLGTDYDGRAEAAEAAQAAQRPVAPSPPAPAG